MFKNGVDIGPHQIIQSDEDEDIQPYGFPRHKRRNRVQSNDMDPNGRASYIILKASIYFYRLIIGECSSSLLGPSSHSNKDQSQSDLSVNLCEIDDSETDELNNSNNYKNNWTKSTTQTDV